MKIYFKIFSVLMVISALVLSIGCARKEESKIKNEVLTQTNLSEILEKIKTDKAFTREDIDYFNASLLRYQTSMDTLYTKTVGQIIEKQKDYLRDASYVSIINTSISALHGFGYLGWQPLEQNNQKFFVFGFAIQNKTKQDIRKVEGLLKFVTMNNQLIKGFRLSVNQDVKTNQTSQFTSTFLIDTTNRNDALLYNLLAQKAQNIYPVWSPSMIELADGKRITVPTLQ